MGSLGKTDRRSATGGKRDGKSMIIEGTKSEGSRLSLRA